MIKLEDAFKLIKTDSTYIFIDGYPVDMRNSKYNIYRSWWGYNKLHCFSCLKEATHFKVKKCKGDGSLHEKSGKRKHFLALYADDDTLFTLDHWFPKWFLKKYNYIKNKSNLVPMCNSCNNKKANTVPILGRYNKSVYVPILRQKYDNMPYMHISMIREQVV